MLNYYIERQKWTRPSSLNIVYIYVIRGSHENRTLAIKHVPRKSWQHYCYVSTLLTLKTHRSTQLFLYCSGGERRVKCVRPALKMEASKEAQRDVVRFLVAEGAATRRKVKTPWNAVERNHPFA